MQQFLADFSNPVGGKACLCWENTDFIAALFKENAILKLSITRKGDTTETPMSWEELMKVKSLCGFGDIDAVEVYPADKDIYNTANIRHLYFIGQLSFALRQ